MNVHPLLKFIRTLESRDDYNAVWGRIAARHRPKKPLTLMTIGEVLAWQDSIDPIYMSEAAGAYQILEDTLRGLYRDAGLMETDLFNEATQDHLATVLLRRRGLTDYLTGRMSATRFAQSLSKEWASLPATISDAQGRAATGQSYYAGDGLNKAHTTIPVFLNVVRAVRETQLPPPPPDVPPAPEQADGRSANAAAALIRFVWELVEKLLSRRER